MSRIQNEDLKSLSELISAGGTKDQLPSSAKIYVGDFGAGKTLSEAVQERLLHGKPMHMHQGSPIDSKLYIDPSQIKNIEGVGISVPPVESILPVVVASSIDFQTGATTGATFNMTIPASTVGQFRRAALTLLSGGAIDVSFSAQALSVGALSDPSLLFVPGGLPIGYVDLECTNVVGRFKTAGSASNIIENHVAGVPRIVVFGAGAGGGAANNGRAASEAITNGATYLDVVFSSPVTSVAYVVNAQMVNLVDADPTFQPLTVTNKTTSGFRVKWNTPVDSGNYLLEYTVPGSISTIAEVAVNSGVTVINVTFPTAFSNTNYALTAELVNTVDIDVQFQPMVVTSKTASGFTVKLNSPTDSSNYKLSYQASAFA